MKLSFSLALSILLAASVSAEQDCVQGVWAEGACQCNNEYTDFQGWCHATNGACTVPQSWNGVAWVCPQEEDEVNTDDNDKIFEENSQVSTFSILFTAL
jgi:hypothetical protein